MEDTHNEDAVFGSDVENGAPQTAVLKERAAPPYDGPPQRGRFGDALQALFKS